MGPTSRSGWPRPRFSLQAKRGQRYIQNVQAGRAAANPVIQSEKEPTKPDIVAASSPSEGPERSGAPEEQLVSSGPSGGPGKDSSPPDAAKPSTVTSSERAASSSPEQIQELNQGKPAKAVQLSDVAVLHGRGPESAAREYAPAGEAPMHVTPEKATATNVREIIFVTSEVAPYSKTGGLGDVCASLPRTLAKRGHRVMVVVPRYAEYKDVRYTGHTIDIDGTSIGYHHTNADGVDLVFVDHPSYQRAGLYGDENGVFGDNQWRFKLLCQAALEAPLQLPLGERGVYGQDCIFMCNDWFAGLVPIYLAARYRPCGAYLGARSILMIHNLCHQGVYSPSTFELLGLPGEWYQSLEWQYPPEQRMGAYEEEGRAINTMKGAITTADRIVTVSPGYAYEIQTPLGGWGMEFLLGSRQYALNGILNGVDETEWNPAMDGHLAEQYSLGDWPDLVGKAKCKAALQRELGLPEEPAVPLVAFIGRLDAQKGADLLLQAAPWIMEQGAQLVCLGTGDSNLEKGLKWLEDTYKAQARGWVGFNVPFSHRLTAGADILLMPSRFEPCGLNQVYAMKYGTVPIAHATGGLRDTVITYDSANPAGTTGWAFEGCTADSLKSSLWQALHLYRNDGKAWKELMKRGMERDCTWNKSAEQYEQVMSWAKTDLPYCG